MGETREASLQQLAGILSEQNNPQADQAGLWRQLSAFGERNDFETLLATILTGRQGGLNAHTEIRQAAALLLKNTLRSNPGRVQSQNDSDLQTLRLHLKAALMIEDRAIRHAAGSATASLVATGCWPDAAKEITQIINESGASSQTAVDGATNAASKATEECGIELMHTLSELAHPLILVSRADTTETGDAALEGVINIATTRPDSLDDSTVRSAVEALFNSASSQREKRRAMVCAGIAEVMHVEPEMVLPSLEPLVEHMLSCCKAYSDSYEVAVQATLFFYSVCDADLSASSLGAVENALPRILPVLLQNMRFEDDDAEVLACMDAGNKPANEFTAERHELKPRHHATEAAGHRSPDDDALEGEFDAYDEESGEWNLRRASAATFDSLSSVFPQTVASSLLAFVGQSLRSGDWKWREASILALGAAANGCNAELGDSIWQAVSMAGERLSDESPLVRLIACWALSRLTPFALASAMKKGEESAHEGLKSVLSALADLTGDKNGKVRESACSALARLFEGLEAQVERHASSMAERLMDSLQLMNGGRQIRVWLDAMSSLALSAGSSMDCKPVHERVWPSLLAMLEADQAHDTMPLIECATSLVKALGGSCSQYSNTITRFSMRTCSSLLSQETIDDEEESLLAASSDLLTALLHSLSCGGIDAAGHFANASRLSQLAVALSAHSLPRPRASGLSMLGECARAGAVEVEPALRLIAAHLTDDALAHDSLIASNNAAWALGVLAKTFSTPGSASSSELNAQMNVLRSQANEIALRLSTVFTANVTMTLLRNASISLGRLASFAPNEIANELNSFAPGWISTLRGLKDTDDKVDAFVGLFNLIVLNPNAVACEMKLTHLLLYSVASWRQMPAQLEPPLRDGLNAIIQSWGGSWSNVQAQLPNAVSTKLSRLLP